MPTRKRRSTSSPPVSPFLSEESGSKLDPCPLCNAQASSVEDMRTHLLTHPRTSLVTYRETLSDRFNLILCPTCTNKPVLCLSKKGFAIHKAYHPALSHRPKNSVLIQKHFSLPESTLATWSSSLSWLLSLPAEPPSFRYSLFPLITPSLRQQVSDSLLQWLFLIREAAESTPAESSTPLPEFESTVGPFITLFFIFEALILAPPGPNEPHVYKKLIPHRLHLLRQGHVKLLYENSFCRPPVPLSTKIPSPEVIGSHVEQAIRHGDFHRATALLQGEPRVALTPHMLAKLEALHPDPVPPPFDAVDLAPGVPPVDLAPFKLHLFGQTLSSSVRGKAPGFLADSPDLLIHVGLSRVPGKDVDGGSLLGYLAGLFLSLKVPPHLWLFLNTNCVMALHKDFANDPEKIRPIGMGTAFRRALGRHIVFAFSKDFASYFVPLDQFAIGISGGTEFVAGSILHAMESMLQTSPNRPSYQEPKAILQLDLVNFFNSVSRPATRRELAANFPDLLALYEHLYPTEGNRVWCMLPDGTWHTFFQRVGSAQGDPLGPFFSCLPLASLLHKLKNALAIRQAARHILASRRSSSSSSRSIPSIVPQYMDDINQVTSLQDVGFTFRFLDRHGPTEGCVLSREKNKICLSVTGSFDFSQLSPSLRSELEWCARTFCTKSSTLFELHGLKVLGTPLGHPTFVRQVLQDKLCEIGNLLSLATSRIKSPQSRFYLFLKSIQHKASFFQLADGVLSDTIFFQINASSQYIDGLSSLYQEFLRNLSRIPALDIPTYSLRLGALPVREGGMAINDPAHSAFGCFTRPFLRFIRSVLLGIVIPSKLKELPTNSKVSHLPRSVLRVPLGKSFRSFFHFRAGLPSYDKTFEVLELLSPSTSRGTWLSLAEEPFPALKQCLQKLSLVRFEDSLVHAPDSFQSVQASLRSSLTSQALTSLPLTLKGCRIPANLFTIAFCRKLRLPLQPEPCPCHRCRSPIDIFGDHFFAHRCSNKILLHNRIRDTIFDIIRVLGPMSGLCASDRHVFWEPSGLLTNFPTLRPADVGVALLPEALTNPSSHLLIDITAVGSPDVSPRDSPLFSLSRHHQQAECLKFAGHSRNEMTPGQLAQAILDQKYSLLPATFDPGGSIGPALAGFLWPASHRPCTFPPLNSPSPPRPSNPPGRTLRDDCYSSVASFGLLCRADIAWRKEHGDLPFTRFINALLPSHWAAQTLGLNLVLAISRQIACYETNAFILQPEHILYTSSYRPRTIRTLQFLSSVYQTRATFVARGVG